jgi:hypothetical protein
MGYMGTGLKKENYTREPRKFFEKRRELSSHQTIRSSASITKSDYHVAGSDWIDKREKRWLKILKVSIGLSTLLFLAYALTIDPIIQRKAREEFEKKYFPALYKTCGSDLQKLVWLHESIPMLHKMNFHTGGYLSIVIKSPDFVYKGDYQGGDNIVNLGGSWNKDYQKFSIHNGILYVDRVNKRYYVPKNWAFIYNGNIHQDVTSGKLFPVLRLTREDFEEFDCDLEDGSFESFSINEHRQLFVDLELYQYGRYEIMAWEMPFEAGRGWSKLDKNVYWRRKA